MALPYREKENTSQQLQKEVDAETRAEIANSVDGLRFKLAVKVSQIDEVISKLYSDGRLDVEYLSGRLLSLEYCFINLSIVHHPCAIDVRLATHNTNPGKNGRQSSRFSLPSRLKVQTPVPSDKVSLEKLFEARRRKDGRLAGARRILIRGQYGMGNTTLCKKIVHDVYKNGLWKNQYHRVVWIPLKRLKQSKSEDVVQLLMWLFPCTELGNGAAEAFRRLIRDEYTLFLLDGLDEVSTVLESDNPGRHVLHSLLSQRHVIVTARPHTAYELAQYRFDLDLETIGFSPLQIDKYLQQVVQDTPTQDMMPNIKSFIQHRPLVHSLAAIPILLDAICYSWETKSFPRDDETKNMASLYLAVSKGLWEHTALRLGRKNEGGSVERLQSDFQTWRNIEKLVCNEMSFLQDLAFQGLCDETIEFGPEYIKNLRLAQIHDSEIVHLAFLRPLERSMRSNDRTFHFIHLTFQDFFAAQHFVSHWVSNEKLTVGQATIDGEIAATSAELLMPVDFVHSRKYLDRYNIFWRFVVGLLQAQQRTEHLYRFLDTLESSPVDLTGLSHQRLIIHCLSELDLGDSKLQARNLLLEDRYIQWSLCQSKLLKSHETSGLRNQSTLLSEAECSDYILEALLAADETTSTVLQVLCNRPSISRRMLDAVSRKLHDDPSEDARNIAIKVIGRHCSHNQVKLLELFDPSHILSAWEHTTDLLEPAITILGQLLQYSDHIVRARAATALGRQPNLPLTAVETLVQMLRDTEHDVRKRAAAVVGRQASLSAGAVETLTQLLQDPDHDVRERAASVLGKHPNLPTITATALMQLLRDPDNTVRREARAALGRQASLSITIVTTLIRLLQDPERNVRLNAAITLEWHENLPATAVEKLTQLLESIDCDLRESASGILRQQASLTAAAATALVHSLRDPETRVCGNAANALARRTNLPATVVETLTQLLHDTDSSVRKRAAGLLGKQAILPTIAVTALIQLLQDLDSSVRRSAAAALGRQHSLPVLAMTELTQLLQDSDNFVQWMAFDVLERQEVIFPTEAVERLTQLFRDPNHDLRTRAMSSLRRQAILPRITITEFTQLLRDPDLYVRWLAAYALGERQVHLPAATVTELTQLLQDPNREVRDKGAAALGKQATLPNTAIIALTQLLRDTNSFVRSRAVGALLGHEGSISAAAVTSLTQLLHDLDGNVRRGAADALAWKKTTVPTAAVMELTQLLYDSEDEVRSSAARALESQATLPTEAVLNLTQRLQTSEYSSAKYVIKLMISRRDMQSCIANLNSLALEHFIRYCFEAGPEACFIWKDSFYMASWERVCRIQIPQHQLKHFEDQWWIARTAVGLPEFIPILSSDSAA